MIALEDPRRRAPSESRSYRTTSPSTLGFDRDRLVVGDGRVLAYLAPTYGGWIDLDFVGGEACAKARLTGAFQRAAARIWARGDEALAQIQVAQTGLAGFEERDLVARRLAIVDELLDEGYRPEDLIKAMGFCDERLGKGYDQAEPRRPKGVHGGGEWTDGLGAAFSSFFHELMRRGQAAIDELKYGERVGWLGLKAVPGVAACAERVLLRRTIKYSVDHQIPGDAVQVRRDDGSAVPDPSSPTGSLLAPTQADFNELYAEGREIADLPILSKKLVLIDDFCFGGQYDFQRNPDAKIFYTAYENVSNYGIGVLANGAGISENDIVNLHQDFSRSASSNVQAERPLRWLKLGYRDAANGLWEHD